MQCNVCNEVNVVLQLEQSANGDGTLSFELQSAAVVMLLSLLEGNTDSSRSELKVTLQFEALQETLNAMWTSVKEGVMSGELDTEEDGEATLDMAFNLYVLLFRLDALPEPTDDDPDALTEVPSSCTPVHPVTAPWTVLLTFSSGFFPPLHAFWPTRSGLLQDGVLIRPGVHGSPVAILASVESAGGNGRGNGIGGGFR